MSTVKIDAAPRSDFGKGAARQLRRHGRIPAVVYGGDIEVHHVSLPDHDLMMALKRAQVILEIDLDGKTTNVAPRQVQKDPVRQVIEHVDLVVLSAQEVRERLVVGQAVAAAEARAAEEELDPVTVTIAMRELLDEGLDADEAINQAVEKVKEELAAQAAAAAAAAAAEDAAAAEADTGEEASAEAGSGDEGSSEE
ncbi:MAG: 50S ribosomal protein L25 [Candidatus Nanopelagicales bacterium]